MSADDTDDDIDTRTDRDEGGTEIIALSNGSDAERTRQILDDCLGRDTSMADFGHLCSTKGMKVCAGMDCTGPKCVELECGVLRRLEGWMNLAGSCDNLCSSPKCRLPSLLSNNSTNNRCLLVSRRRASTGVTSAPVTVGYTPLLRRARHEQLADVQGRVGKHRKSPGGRGMAGGQHHHRTNIDKYHPGKYTFRVFLSVLSLFWRSGRCC